jgi:hypothetical protein
LRNEARNTLGPLQEKLMNRIAGKKLGVALLSVMLIGTALPRSAAAAIIDTQTVVTASSRADTLTRIDRALSQEQVGERLVAMGVDRAAIDSRLASLTDAELASLADRLDNAPAGGDVLGVLGVVFVVLLVLELVGVIDVFKTVGPPR